MSEVHKQQLSVPETKEGVSHIHPLISTLQGEIRGEVETMLSKYETVDVDGVQVDVIDSEPKEKKTDVPVVIVPGIGYTKTSKPFVDMIRGVNKRGRRSLTVYNLHGIDTEVKKGGPAPQIRKAMAYIKALEAKKITKADAFGHSEGAVILAIAAKMRPDLFRNIVLYNPAGVAENDTHLSVLSRFALEGAKEFSYGFRKAKATHNEKVFGKIGLKEAIMNYVFTKHALKLPAAGIGVAGAQVAKTYRELQEKGVGVSIITTKNDLVFRHQSRPKRVSKETGVPLERIRTIPGGHLVTGDKDTEVLMDTMEEELASLEKEQRSERKES